MKPPQALRLISHYLCPYVQRAVIALSEKGVAHERIVIDLAAKPDWFIALSPLGKVPLLLVDDETALFESAVICEYLEETAPGVRLHPGDPVERARHRAWIEFASATLGAIAGLYGAPDAGGFESKRADLAAKMAWLEQALASDRARVNHSGREAASQGLGAGPYFAGERFSFVDAAFGPVFRYFDTFEATLPALRVFDLTPQVRSWRAALSARPSVQHAVAVDYPERLTAFLQDRGSHLSRCMTARSEP